MMVFSKAKHAAAGLAAVAVLALSAVAAGRLGRHEQAPDEPAPVGSPASLVGTPQRRAPNNDSVPPETTQSPTPPVGASKALDAVGRRPSPAVAAEAPPEGMDDPRSQAILVELEKPTNMPFAQDTPLEDVVKYIQAATTNEQLPKGIPIYVDRAGLQEVKRTMQSPISLDVEGIEGISLKRSLYFVLIQLDLSYTVQEGLLLISTRKQLDRFLSDTPIYQGKKP